jgi:hypothetical protein
MTQDRSTTRAGHFHAVRFYEDNASLCRIVADFLADGFVSDLPGIVIATPVHQFGIVNQLAELSLDVQQLQARGALLMLDAGETLARFMVDGMPDAERFHEAMSGFIENACGGRKDCVVRAYGEMVDVLWQAGMHAAAIRLEMLWNQLANTQQFSLLCGYSMGSFYKDAAYAEICHQHSHIVSSQGEAAIIN